MQISISRAAVFDRALQALPFVFALCAIALLAYWLTVLTAPRPVAELPAVSAVQDGHGAEGLVRLFGSGDVAASYAGDLELVGVFADARGGGFAAFNTSKGPVSALAGAEIVPGVVLVRVGRDGVVISRSGARQELALRPAVPPASAPPSAVTAQAGQEWAGGVTNPQPAADAGQALSKEAMQ